MTKRELQLSINSSIQVYFSDESREFPCMSWSKTRMERCAAAFYDMAEAQVRANTIRDSFSNSEMWKAACLNDEPEAVEWSQLTSKANSIWRQGW